MHPPRRWLPGVFYGYAVASTVYTVDLPDAISAILMIEDIVDDTPKNRNPYSHLRPTG